MSDSIELAAEVDHLKLSGLSHDLATLAHELPKILERLTAKPESGEIRALTDLEDAVNEVMGYIS